MSACGVLSCVWMKIAVKPPVTSRAEGSRPMQLPVAGAEHRPRVAAEAALTPSDRYPCCAECAPATTGRGPFGGPAGAPACRPCPASQPEPHPQPMDDDRPPRLWWSMWKRFALAAVLIAALARHRDRDRGAEQGQRARRRGFPHAQPNQSAPKGLITAEYDRRPADLPGSRHRPPGALQRRARPRKPAAQRHDPARPLRPRTGPDVGDVDPARPARHHQNRRKGRSTPTRRSTPPTRSAAGSVARARAACWRPKRSSGKCSRR